MSVQEAWDAVRQHKSGKLDHVTFSCCQAASLAFGLAVHVAACKSNVILKSMPSTGEEFYGPGGACHDDQLCPEAKALQRLPEGGE